GRAMIRVGTSGWSHPAWVGPFYPVPLRAKPDAWLRHYATRFRSVEVSGTFDAMPDEALVTSWAREGIELSHPHPFEFSLALPRPPRVHPPPPPDVGGPSRGRAAGARARGRRSRGARRRLRRAKPARRHGRARPHGDAWPGARAAPAAPHGATPLADVTID